MVVYIEFAFAENFFIDFTLLFLAVKTVKGKVKLLSLTFSALVGTAFALVFPLLELPNAVAVALKLLAGVLLCLLAVRRGKLKQTLIMTGFFYLYTFCLGGLLIAVYNMAGWEYTENGLFVLSSAPAALVISGAVFFAILLLSSLGRIFRRIKFIRKSIKCSLTLRGKRVEERALLDSGNCLTVDGNPVSIVSLSLAARLVDGFHQVTKARKVEVSTVNGVGTISVFQIDEMQIYSDGQVHTIIGAYLGIGKDLSDDCAVILNSAYIPSGGEL